MALRLDVRRAVAALPLPYRQVVILRYVHNLSYKDIADVLGISAAAAEVRAHRAREMLRQRLAKVVNDGVYQGGDGRYNRVEERFRQFHRPP